MRLYRLVVLSWACAWVCAVPALAQDGWDGVFDTGAARQAPAAPERTPLPKLAVAANSVAPSYPADAVREGRQGTVALSFSVTADGKVIPPSAKVAESSGFADLDRQAVAWVTTLRFRPIDIPDPAHKAAGQYIRVAFALDGGKPMVSATEVALLPPAVDPNLPIVMPPYPPEARAAGEQGTTLLQFRVRADGFIDPSSIGVLSSSGHKRLDDAAIAQAATSWRFLPASDNGRPVAAWFMYRCPFTLTNR